MYFALGLKDILVSTRLSIEFYDSLDEFHLAMVDSIFNEFLEETMGLMTEIETYNFQLFNDFKRIQIERELGIDLEELKKAA